MTVEVDAPKHVIHQKNAGLKVYYISQAQGDTLLKTATYEGRLSDLQFVGKAKLNTRAAYYSDVTGDKRMIICLLDDDILGTFDYQTKTGRWKAGNLAQHKVEAIPEAPLAVASDVSGNLHVFYRSKATRSLNEIVQDAKCGQWGVPRSFDGIAKPAEKSVIAAITYRDEIFLYYEYDGEDNAVHKLTLKHGQDTPPTDSVVDGTNDKFRKIQLEPYLSKEGDKHGLQVVPQNGAIYSIEGDGDAKQFVAETAEDGSLKLTTDAQCCRWPPFCPPRYCPWCGRRIRCCC